MVGWLKVNGLVRFSPDEEQIYVQAGHADLHFTEPVDDDTTGGTGRYWQLHLHSWRKQASISGLQWTFLDYSPFNN